MMSLRLLFAAVVLALGLSGGAIAGPWPEPMSEAQLGAVRAGYVSADGVTFAFSVTLQTYVGGQLALASTMSLDSAAGPTFGSFAQPGAAATASGASGVTTAALAGGATTLLQQFTPTSIRNLVSTSASNQVIAQSTDVTLALAGFQQNQAAYQLKSAVTNVAAQMAAGFLTSR